MKRPPSVVSSEHDKISIRLLIAVILAANISSCHSGDRSGIVNSLRVRVVDYSNHRVANAPVVLGNRDGQLISYGTTDVNGEYIFFNPPQDATVGVFSICSTPVSAPRPDFFKIVYDVNASETTLNVSSCATPILGMMDVTVTDVPLTASRANVGFGGIPFTVSNDETRSIFASQGDLQSDGKVSLVAVAYDSNDYPFRFGVLPDLTVSSQMTATISVNQISPAFVRYQLANIPSGGSLWGQVDVYRKSHMMYMPQGNLSAPSTVNVMDVPYLPGFGDEFTYNVNFTYDAFHGNGSVGISIIRSVEASPMDQSFDFSGSLSIPSNLVVSYPTGTARPTISWSGTDPLATAINGGLELKLSTSSYLYGQIVAAPSRTGISFPELPDILADFRPVSVHAVSIGRSAYDSFRDYADYLAYLDKNGGLISSLTGTYKWSSASWWETPITWNGGKY